MSLDRYVDTYFDNRDALPMVEVEPDHLCQEFAPTPGVSIFASGSKGERNHHHATGGADLAGARALVDELLRR